MGQKQSSSPQVVLLGLDSSGKSTLLSRLLCQQLMQTSPTVGFNVGTLTLDKKSSLTIWDVGGQRNMRAHWLNFLDDVQVLVYVVDSSDRDRVKEARKALRRVLSDERVRGVPLMVLANKKDLPGTMTIREVSSLLDLSSYSDLRWEVQACSALKAIGLQQAFLSVSKLIKKS